MIVSQPPPPAPNTWRFYLDRTARIAAALAMLLVTAVSVRFGIAGLEHALDFSRSNFSDRPVSHSGQGTTVPAVVSAHPRAPTAGGSVAADPPPGKPLRVTLGVNAGPPRSEVYVGGRRVGQTPFLGDTSCKSGQSIRIEIVPQQGAPLTYERPCRGRMIEISALPP